MNTYVHRWRLAVALKQPYPRPETGAEDATTSTAAPPVFIPIDDAKKTKDAFMWGSIIGAIVGVGGMYLVLSLPD
jgi:hypothetical protein